MHIRSILDNALLFGTMPESARTQLAAAATIRRWHGGDYVWRVGECGDNLQIVGEGLVLIGAMGPDGEEILLHVVARGDSMGEPSIYASSRERQTDARAVGPTTLVVIPGRSVRPVLESCPEAMRVFVERVSEICRGHARRVAAAAFHDARGRLARVILDLAMSHGASTPVGRRIELALPQRIIAGLTSLRRETVNRALKEFETDGALRIDDGRIIVRNPDILRAALGADGQL